MTTERKRGNWIYATADGSMAIKVDIPFGFIAPPTIVLHKPSVGPVEFYATNSHTSIRVRPTAFLVDAEGWALVAAVRADERTRIATEISGHRDAGEWTYGESDFHRGWRAGIDAAANLVRVGAVLDPVEPGGD